MSHKQETDQDIDDALNASFNGLATGQMDKREVKARLHAVQQKLDEVKRMSRAEQLRFFEDSYGRQRYFPSTAKFACSIQPFM